jgi:hypothetical protein
MPIEQIDSLINREREKESLRDDEDIFPCYFCGTECEYDDLKFAYGIRLACEDCYDDLEG